LQQMTSLQLHHLGYDRYLHGGTPGVREIQRLLTSKQSMEREVGRIFKERLDRDLFLHTSDALHRGESKLSAALLKRSRFPDEVNRVRVLEGKLRAFNQRIDQSNHKTLRRMQSAGYPYSVPSHGVVPGDSKRTNVINSTPRVQVDNHAQVSLGTVDTAQTGLPAAERKVPGGRCDEPLGMQTTRRPHVPCTGTKGSDESAIPKSVGVLFQLFKFYGLADRRKSMKVRLAFEKTCRFWSQRSAEVGGSDGWMKYAKYKLASFFHYHTRALNSAPILPPGVTEDHPAQLVAGSVGVWLRRKLRPMNDESWSILTSINIGAKSGMPRPDAKQITASVAKTVSELTTPHAPVPPRWLTELPIEDLDGSTGVRSSRLVNDLSMEIELRRTVTELFRGKTFTDDMRYEPKFPTTSATFQHSQREGGGVTSVRELAESIGLLDDVKSILKSGGVHLAEVRTDLPMRESFTRPRPVELDDWLWMDDAKRPKLSPWVPASLSDQRKHVASIRGQKLVSPKKRYLAHTRWLRDVYQGLYRAGMQQAMVETPYVKPVGLAEALKVRVITKGPALTGFVQKPLQKHLWKTLASHPVFRLIGIPISKWIVQDAMRVSTTGLRKDEVFLSGDYTGATNNLNPQVSEIIADQISIEIGLTEDEKLLFKRTLTQHVFLDEKTRQLKPQVHGQLMGSVVSFPVLCVANAAMCRWSLEQTYGRHISLRNAPLLINGDDVLMKTLLRRGVDNWEKITEFGGLIPSVGKYYASQIFAQINSRNFLYDRVGQRLTDLEHVGRTCHFTPVPFVNMGLLLGLKRSGEIASTGDIYDTYQGMGARARELISWCPPLSRGIVMKEFIGNHWDALHRVQLPWHIPVQYGGVGLPVVVSWGSREKPRYGPSKQNLVALAMIKKHPDLYAVGPLPLDATWDIHSLIMKRLPPLETFTATKGEEHKFSNLYGMMAIDVMLTEENLLRRSDAQNVRSVIRRNEKSWSRALKAAQHESVLVESVQASQNTFKVHQLISVD